MASQSQTKTLKDKEVTKISGHQGLLQQVKYSRCTVMKLWKESPLWLPWTSLAKLEIMDPIKMSWLPSLNSIDNTPNFTKQAIIANPTLTVCHIKPILVPWVFWLVSLIVSSPLSNCFDFLEKLPRILDYTICA